MRTLVRYYDADGRKITAVLFEQNPEELFGHKPELNKTESISLRGFPEYKHEQPFCVTRVGKEMHSEHGEVHSIMMRQGGRVSS